MAVRKPLVVIGGELQELPIGDSLPVPEYSPMTPEEAEGGESTDPRIITPVVLKDAVKKWAVMPSVYEDDSLTRVIEGGTVTRIESQPYSEAVTIAELVEDYNSLIDKLKASGLML